LHFLSRFLKNSQVSNITNIRQVGSELFHADGQTYRQIWRSYQSLSQFCQGA